jgi:hypothetical protein
VAHLTRIAARSALILAIVVAAGVRLRSPRRPVDVSQHRPQAPSERQLPAHDDVLRFSTVGPGDAVVLTGGADRLLCAAVRTRAGRDAVSFDRALSTGRRVIVIEWTPNEALVPVRFNARIREVEGWMYTAGLQRVRRMVYGGSDNPDGQWTIFVGDR